MIWVTSERDCAIIRCRRNDYLHHRHNGPRNFAKNDPLIDAALNKSLIEAFEEDRAVITAQARALADAPDSSMIPFAVDTALSHFRRLIKRALASEGKSDGPRI